MPPKTETALDSLADRPQWVAWKSVDGRKLPYSPRTGRKAKSDTPATWGTRNAAEGRAKGLVNGSGSGGVGIMLGAVDGLPGARLGGVDLDSCRDPESGDLEPWAADVIERFDSYAEISPSGRGVKVFFTYDPADAPELRGAMGTDHGKSFSRGNHCEIALHLSNRYFTVTGESIDSAPLRPVALPDLRWLIDEAGPAFVGGTVGSAADNSRSGRAYKLALSLQGEGATFDDFQRACAEDSDLAAYAKERRGRQLKIQRDWDRAGEENREREQQLVDEFEDLPPSPPKAARLAFLSPAECEASAPRGYVWKGVLAPRDVGCIFGAPGVGKSLVAPHIGYLVARGQPVFDMRTRQGRVFYVAAEDESGMRGRVTALRDRHGDARRFTLVCGVSNLLTPGSADLKALRAAIAEERPALVIVDTLAMAFPGLEENSAEAMGRVVAVARKMTEHGAAVILIHHDTKAEGQTPRGHSVLNGALDMALHLTKGEDGIVRGKLTKNRNGTCDRDIAFRIETRSFGTDDDGDPITAALAEELAPGTAPKHEKLSASEQAALDVLKELGGRATESKWRAACVNGRTVSTSENSESRRKAANRSILRLSQKQLVEFRDGTFAIPDPFEWEDDEDI